MSIAAWFIDRLPRRLWRPGNLYLNYRLHFCIGIGRDGQTLRTVEWQGREIAHGVNAAEDLLAE